MASSNFTIRTMSRDEMSIAVDWAAVEGWNPGVHDADSFYAADPEGFLIGELNQKPIATLSAVAYGNTFGFLGFYIVHPAYRGQGYGLQIWNAGLKRLAGRNIGLDGVLAQQTNYRKSGFKLAYRNIRYEGIRDGSTASNPDIVPLSQFPFAVVEEYDRPFFPDTRSRFLHAWLKQPESVALGIAQDRKLSGYGVVRTCRTGYKIGPLFADSSEAAEALFIALKDIVPPGKSFFLDVPETNHEAITLTKRHNMKRVFETARMYTGRFPVLPGERLFGVTTFELG